jgi:hypothetical protein
MLLDQVLALRHARSSWPAALAGWQAPLGPVRGLLGVARPKKNHQNHYSSKKPLKTKMKVPS